MTRDRLLAELRPLPAGLSGRIVNLRTFAVLAWTRVEGP